MVHCIQPATHRVDTEDTRNTLQRHLSLNSYDPGERIPIHGDQRVRSDRDVDVSGLGTAGLHGEEGDRKQNAKTDTHAARYWWPAAAALTECSLDAVAAL